MHYLSSVYFVSQPEEETVHQVGWFLLHGCIEMHGQQNLKRSIDCITKEPNYAQIHL
jgi:hypothetical protein